ncbi:hypothetical protein [Modestobacter italicus]|uniref:hypothetical protein n=1 Tax=Modestobacter italicus (strain DSM 44449 / CECT 9708 / BC 501) TaxID=2732864 RepID=UPI001C956CF6|nr:hypothetical protein [Modestobacter italicus]
MRALHVSGFVLLLMGISGVIDHLWVQPVMSPVLNVLERQVFPRVDLLADHALLANAGVAVLGLVVLFATDPDRS